MLKRLVLLMLLVIGLVSLDSFGFDDCNLPYGDPPIGCCADKWGGDFDTPPPEIAFVVFQDVNRTDRSPVWKLILPPNDRAFLLRLYESEPPSLPQSKWSYNLDDIGGVGGVESDIWVVHFDLLAFNDYNVYLANKVDDPPADMRYFVDRGHTDCNTVFHNELYPDGLFQGFFAGGTAEIFFCEAPDFGDFNGDDIVDFIDYAILVASPDEIPIECIASFARNWLQVYD